MTTYRYTVATGASVSVERLPAVWPSHLVPAEQSLNLVANSARQTNGFTKTLQAAPILDSDGQGTGARWTLSFALKGLDESQFRDARAFVSGQRGQARRFLFPAIPGTLPSPAQLDQFTGRLAPRDVPEEAPLVLDEAGDVVFPEPGEQPAFVYFRQAAWLATVIPATGFEPMATAMRAGDYLSFDDSNGVRKLCTVVKDAVANLFGDADLIVEPPVAFHGAENRLIDVKNPSGTFVLQSDEEGSFERTPEQDYSCQINAAQIRSLRRPVLTIGVEPVVVVPGEPVDLPTAESFLGTLIAEMRFARYPMLAVLATPVAEFANVEFSFSIDGGEWSEPSTSYFDEFQPALLFAQPSHIQRELYAYELQAEPFAEIQVRVRTFGEDENWNLVPQSQWSSPLVVAWPTAESYSDDADVGGPDATGEIVFDTSNSSRLVATATSPANPFYEDVLYEFQFRVLGDADWLELHASRDFGEGFYVRLSTDEFAFNSTLVPVEAETAGLELRVRAVQMSTALQGDWATASSAWPTP